MENLKLNINAVYDPNNSMIRFIREYNEKKDKMIEESWQLVIKPKPKFIPSFIWKWLLNRMMYIRVGLDIGGKNDGNKQL